MGEGPATERRLVTEPAGDGVFELRLDRPARRNAIDAAMLAALHAAVDEAAGARAVLLTSSDPAAFCAGADIHISAEERRAVSDGLYELYGRLVEHPAVVIAVLSGPAVGGGAQLAIAADLRVADRTASIRLSGPGHGLAVGAWALPSLVGRGRAVDLCLSMRPVRAEEAHAIGLVDRVADDALAAARALARDLAALDPDATAAVKRLVVEGAGLRAALEAERARNRGWDGALVDPPRSRGAG